MSTVLSTPQDTIISKVDRIKSTYDDLNDSITHFQSDFKKSTKIDSISNLAVVKKIAPNTINLLPENKFNNTAGKITSNIKIPSASEFNLIRKDRLSTITDKIPEKKKWLKMPFGKARSIKQAIDTGNYEHVEKFAEQKIASEFDELNQLQNGKGDLPIADIDKVKEIEWDPKKIANSKKTSELIANNADKLVGAFKQVDKLKKNYSKVNLLNANGPVMEPISKKPEKRWVYGLGFQGNWQNQLNLSVAPIIGYKINKKWTVGLSGVMQLAIGVKDSISVTSKNTFSYRIFSQYVIYKNIFVHAEFEQPYKLTSYKNQEPVKNKLLPQAPNGWIGLGVEYNIYKKLKGQTQVMYNIVPPDYTKRAESRWGLRVNLIVL